MRNMSFSKTLPQMRRRKKTVTRRKGWKFLDVGDHVRPVEKAMGLQKGEKVQPIFEDGTVLRVVDVRRQKLSVVPHLDAPCPTCFGNGCRRCEKTGGMFNPEAIEEGFPEMTGADFVEFFCREMRCKPDTEVTRIEFEFVQDPEVSR